MTNSPTESIEEAVDETIVSPNSLELDLPQNLIGQIGPEGGVIVIANENFIVEEIQINWNAND
jgi:hypothetical protein